MKACFSCSECVVSRLIRSEDPNEVLDRDELRRCSILPGEQMLLCKKIERKTVR